MGRGAKGTRMNAEGLGMVASAEWLQALLTALPIVLVAAWLLIALGTLQRRAVWTAVAESAALLREEIGGELRPRWAGVRLQSDDLRIDWVSGLRGTWTRVQIGRRTRRARGLLVGDGILAVLDAIKREGR